MKDRLTPAPRSPTPDPSPRVKNKKPLNVPHKPFTLVPVTSRYFGNTRKPRNEPWT